jgi:hypothetical protein
MTSLVVNLRFKHIDWTVEQKEQATLAGMSSFPMYTVRKYPNPQTSGLHALLQIKDNLWILLPCNWDTAIVLNSDEAIGMYFPIVSEQQQILEGSFLPGKLRRYSQFEFLRLHSHGDYFERIGHLELPWDGNELLPRAFYDDAGNRFREC